MEMTKCENSGYICAHKSSWQEMPPFPLKDFLKSQLHQYVGVFWF